MTKRIILIFIILVSWFFFPKKVQVGSRNEIIENDDYIDEEEISYYNDYCCDLDMVYSYFEN